MTTVLRINVRRPTLRIKTGTIPVEASAELDAGLQSLAVADDTEAASLLSTIGPNQWVATPITAKGRTLLAQATNAEVLSTLGVTDYAQTLLLAETAEEARATLEIDEWTTLVLGADQPNDTTTAAVVQGLEFEPEANALYEIEATLLFSSAATTTGMQAGLWGPSSGATWTSQNVTVPTGVVTSVQRHGPMDASAAGTGVSSVLHVYPARLLGLVRTGPEPTGTISARFNSEVSGSAITVLAGSFLRYRRLS